jgi:hypothetical protein
MGYDYIRHQTPIYPQLVEQAVDVSEFRRLQWAARMSSRPHLVTPDMGKRMVGCDGPLSPSADIPSQCIHSSDVPNPDIRKFRNASADASVKPRFEG